MGRAVDYSGERWVGGLHLFYRELDHVRVTDSSVEQALRLPRGAAPDAVNLRGTTAGAVVLDAVSTRHDVYAAGLACDDLSVPGADVGRDLAVPEAQVQGRVVADGSQVGRYLDARDAALGGLSARDARVRRTADLRGATVDGDVDLRGSSGGLLRLDADVGGVVDMRGVDWDGVAVTGEYDFRFDAATGIDGIYREADAGSPYRFERVDGGPRDALWDDLR